MDVFHRPDLRTTAAGRAALHPEYGAKARLAQCDQRLLADPVQGIAEPDRRGGFALACRRRADRGDKNQLAVGPILETGEISEREFGLEAAIALEMLLGNAQTLPRNTPHPLHPRSLRH